MANNQIRQITIKVDTKNAQGLKDVADKMGYLSKNTKSLATNMGFLSSAFGSWLGYLGVREITQMADSFQNMNNMLKISTGSAENGAMAFQKIADIAERTNQQVSEVGSVFNRMANSLRGTGASINVISDLTETLINTFRVSGATTTETTNTIIQLSQAFSSMELRGQELRSMMEQNSFFAKMLKDRFGSDIYKKAQEGAISLREVLKLLVKEQNNVNETAKQIQPTFEQVIGKVFNRIFIAVGQLNEKYQLSTKFLNIMMWTLDNFSTIVIVAATVKFVQFGIAIKKAVEGFAAFRVAVMSFSASNPLLLALTGIAAAAALVYTNMDKIKTKFGRGDSIEALESRLESLIKKRDKAIDFKSKGGLFPQKEIDNIVADIDKVQKSLDEARGKLAPEEGDKKDNLSTFVENMKNLTKGDVDKLKDILARLNREYQNGSITLEEYNQKLVNFEMYKLNREFSDGKMDIFAFSERLKELNIDELNRKLNAGVISIERFRSSVKFEELNILDMKLKQGKISLDEYHASIIKIDETLNKDSAFHVGATSYIESIGTVSEQVAKGIQGAFTSLETSMTEFIMTGRQDWKKFTESVLNDLAAIVVRTMILRPLLQGILGGASGGTEMNFNGATPNVVNAKGNAFSNGNIVPFAKGGIVDSPSLFSFGGGRKTGLMGEAGTEAILPLARSGNGDLGVQASVTPVNINIVNNSNADITTRESNVGGQRTIDVLIENKVKEGFARGSYDKSLQQNYGLKRKGV